MKGLLYILLIVVLFSCRSEQKTVHKISAEAGLLKDSSFAGSCPYLFKTADGRIVLSWVRDLSDTVAVVCYAVSSDGIHFDSTVVVPGSTNVHPHGENLPRVAITPTGNILAAWGASNPNPKNPYSGLVYYSWSLDNGRNWTTPQTLSKDTSSIDQRYFDLAVLKDSSVAVIWLDSRKNTDKEGSSLFFATFNEQHILADERPIDVTCCQCCRTDLFVDRQGSLHTVYRKIINDSIRDMVHSVSVDQGKTFSAPERISIDNWAINGCPHSGPAIIETPRTGLSFVWYTLGNGSGVFYSTSKDNGKTFSNREQVSAAPSAKHPQLETHPDGAQLIVWDESAAAGNRVGLEIRSEAGEKLSNGFLTDSTAFASFPVIKSIGDQYIVAFTGRERADEKEQVRYQLINPFKGNR